MTPKTRLSAATSAACCALLVAACSQAPPPDKAAVDPAEVATAQAGIENRGSAAEAEADSWWAQLPRPEWAEFEEIDTGSEWFDVYRIMDGIYAISESGQFEEVISYLIEGEDQALLFDTGLGIGDIRALAARLTSKPLRVLNSHSHYDHIGGNYQFDTIIGRDIEFTRARASGIPHEYVVEYATGDWVWKPYPPGFDPERYAIRPYSFSSWIDEGQFIDLGGVSLELVYSPGHAPDCLVLIDHQRRLMFTGDTFYLAPLYAHLDGSSFTDYASSARKLANLVSQVDQLLMSHNTPLAESGYLLKLAAAFEAIENGSATFEPGDGEREYGFGEFSILTFDPPVAREPEPQ